jgi:uncharacterized protein (TIGR02284 family)
MDNDELLLTLRDLIETCRDGDEGFRACAEQTRDNRLKAFYANRAQSCAAAAVELQDVLRACGGDPNAPGLGGPTRRRWLDLKQAVAGRDDKAILKECERGEDVAVASYRQALAKDLPPDIRAHVERQYQGALKNHDEVKSLRDQYRSG